MTHSKNVTIELDRDNAQLVLVALRWAAQMGDERVASGEVVPDPMDNSTDRLRWVARYLDAKIAEVE